MPSEQMSMYIKARTRYVRWDNVCFALLQHASMDLIVVPHISNSLR